MKNDSMTTADAVCRIDVWLWAVRLYKTRNQAAQACRKNAIKVNGLHVKPAKSIRVGDRIEIDRDFYEASCRVKQLLDHRVGAKLVPDYLEDTTPEEVREAATEKIRTERLSRPRRATGSGRPTKRERRSMKKLEEQE